MAVRKKGPDPIEYSTTLKPKSEKKEFSYTTRETETPRPKVKRMAKKTPSTGTSSKRRTIQKPKPKAKQETVRVAVPEKKGITIQQKINNPSPPKKKSVNRDMSSSTSKSRIKRIKSPKKSYSGKKAKCA